MYSWIARLPRVLIVDDSADGRLLVERMLESSGWFRTISVESGSRALEVVDQMEISFVLLDVELPDMKGWDVARQLQRNPNTKHIPIIAITGHSKTSVRKHSEEVGCVAFLTKPIRKRVLLEQMSTLLHDGCEGRNMCVNFQKSWSTPIPSSSMSRKILRI